MIEMKYKFGWILFSFCIFPIILLGIITYDIWDDNIYPTVGIAAISFLTDLAMFIILGVLFLSWFPNLILKLGNFPVIEYKFLKKAKDSAYWSNYKDKLFGMLFMTMFFPIILLSYVMKDNVDLSKDLLDQKFPPSIIIFLALMILPFRWALNFKIIFNDNGITTGKNVVEIPWSAVRKVDYNFFSGFSFEYMQNGKTFFQCINYMFANRKEGIEFAFRKIAEHNIAVLVITSDAKEKFEKKCGLKIPRN
jgi:hypothetical protein